jgi:hypothetical protein
MSVTLSLQADTCPSLFNPFVGTKHFTAQKAWDVFALHQCGVPVLSTVLVDAGSHQVKKTYHTCADWTHCAYVSYSLCPVVCVLPKYFDDPAPVWPVDTDTTPSMNWLKKQNKKQAKQNLKTADLGVSVQSLSSLCKQLMKQNKKQKKQG